MPRLAPLSCCLLALACGDGGGGGDDHPLALLVADYEAGRASRDQVVAALSSFPAWEGPLAGSLDGVVVLRARAQPWSIAENTTIASGGLLVVEPGATVTLGPDATLAVHGKLYALGTKDRPVTIEGAEGAPYRTLLLDGRQSELTGLVMRRAVSLLTVKETGDTPILVADSRLDHWQVSAIEMDHADGLVVRNNLLGVDTPLELSTSEALHGKHSAVRVEGNTFARRAGYNDAFDLQPCKGGHFPVLVGNTFLGGDDDAIDLDNCDAIIVGNRLSGFRPGPTAAGQANGGGITGEGDSNPLVFNNVIDDCVHAIGFKDGARPLVLNNTITNCDIGITMYSADLTGQRPAGDGIAINNVLWNVATDVLLNGSWYPAYHPETTGRLDASFNVMRDPAYAGMNDNDARDPLLEARDGIPHLRAGSPARGTGQGDLAAIVRHSIFPAEVVRRWLGTDLVGTPRPFAGGRFVGIDRGAVQHP